MKGVSGITPNTVKHVSGAKTIVTSGYGIDATNSSGSIVLALNEKVWIWTDQKNSGTAGGASIAAWTTRALNTRTTDGGSDVTLASNQLTFQPGKYYIEARVPAYGSGLHKTRLQSVTLGTVLLLGTSEDSGTATPYQTTSVLRGVINVVSPQVVRIDHRVSSARATNGYGIATSLDSEVYTTITIVRIN